jgi:hypothetical protein
MPPADVEYSMSTVQHATCSWERSGIDMSGWQLCGGGDGVEGVMVWRGYSCGGGKLWCVAGVIKKRAGGREGRLSWVDCHRYLWIRRHNASS